MTDSTRREFLKTTAAAGAGSWIAASGLEPVLGANAGVPAWRRVVVAKAAEPLRVLILGGTGFLGPHTVDHARARGHAVTLFNRGKRNPGMFPDLETILGDRDGKLEGLKGRTWDAVIDTSGYVPRIVKMSAELLAPSVKRYVFISTISVYGESVEPGADESHPVEQVPDPSNEEVMKHYGGLKALCEKAAAAAFPGRSTAIRPGLIVGPLDPTDRFTYWPVRIARGGEVLAPGDGTDPVQIVDVRDLAAFIVRTVEERVLGTFNAVGPAEPMTMRAMLEACRAASGSGAKLTWVDAEFLEAHEVAPWTDMPAWVPGTGESAGFARIDCRKALAAGLAFRPVLSTAGDTLGWWRSLPDERTARLEAGITPEREARVLAAWHEAQAPARP